MSSGNGVLNTPFELVTSLGFAGFVLLLLAMPMAFWAVSSQSRAGLVRLLVAVANLLFTAQLILRWWQSGHFPISNLYESLCFLAWACTLTQLLVERAWPSPIVAAAATPMGLGCIAFASFALPDQLQSAAPLVPALRSSWLVMHVSVIMVSYAALLVGSLLSLAVLVTDRDQSLELRSSSIGSGGYRQAASIANGGSVQLQSVQLSTNEQLDSLSYRTITVGFLMLTVGIVSGAVWANEAWGSYWSWDPKETWALICWLVYAAWPCGDRCLLHRGESAGHWFAQLRLVFLTSTLCELDRGSTAIDLTSNKGTANSPGRNRPDPVVLFGKRASQGST